MGLREEEETGIYAEDFLFSHDSQRKISSSIKLRPISSSPLHAVFVPARENLIFVSKANGESNKKVKRIREKLEKELTQNILKIIDRYPCIGPGDEREIGVGQNYNYKLICCTEKWENKFLVVIEIYSKKISGQSLYISTLHPDKNYYKRYRNCVLRYIIEDFKYILSR